MQSSVLNAVILDVVELIWERADVNVLCSPITFTDICLVLGSLNKAVANPDRNVKQPPLASSLFILCLFSFQKNSQFFCPITPNVCSFFSRRKISFFLNTSLTYISRINESQGRPFYL